ncbi:hypothetical protein [Sphingobium sp. KCTC 72723]|uniref:hypothetical protein n=1 Tax=Sphingobium sp. KCTC 72723 TaxID=2733867 RepID=UPI00165D3371|nr:hypothetical protein [Sphingobium sp. KCTC 72723]
MPLVHITLSNVQARADTGATMPIPDSVEGAADTMQSGGASAQSSIVADGPVLLKARFWTIAAKGDVWVKFGSDPLAAADAGHLVLANQPRSFAVTAVGEKVAIKDAV